MTKRSALGAAVLGLCTASAAAMPLVTLIPGPRTIDENGTPVNLSSGGVLNLPDGPTIPMTTIGGGLRKKKVLFSTFKVYAAQFLVDASDAATFDRTPARALESTDRIRAVAMYLTFDRHLSAQQLSNGLNDAMSANGYKVNENPDLQALSRAITANGAIRSGTVGILAAVGVDAETDLVVYQSPSGTISSVKGRAGLKHAVMAAWFGKPVDAQMGALRDEILGTEAGRGPAVNIGWKF